MRRFNASLRVLLLAAGSSTLAAAQSSPATVTPAQFKQLNWLSGIWRGSGGAYAAFFEECRFLNGSTWTATLHPSSPQQRETVYNMIGLKNP